MLENKIQITDYEEDLENKVFYQKWNFYVELVIFIISVSGAICVASNHAEGFFLWLLSNSIALLYFIITKQYPLSVQQFVFLGTTCLGIYNNFSN